MAPPCLPTPGHVTLLDDVQPFILHPVHHIGCHVAAGQYLSHLLLGTPVWSVYILLRSFLWFTSALLALKLLGEFSSLPFLSWVLFFFCNFILLLCIGF